MNIAFGTALILFLLTPGFAFRYSFLQGPYSRRVSKPTFTEELFWALLPAIFLQLLGLCIISQFYEVALGHLYYLLIGASKTQIDFVNVRASIPYFLAYQLILLCLSLGLGYGIRNLVFKYELDQSPSFTFLKVKNDFYYLFNDRKGNEALPEFIQLDVLVSSAEGEVIYCGFLEDYFLAPDNEISRLILSNVYRRKMKTDKLPEETEEEQNSVASPNLFAKEFDDRYYNMEGNYLIIPGKEILNLNITYYQFQLESEV